MYGTFSRVTVRGEVLTVAMSDEGRSGPMTKRDFEALARFRFAVRSYLRFSDETVRQHGLTPQHYQLLLALKGFPGREWASVGELAERLQLRHHSTVELINRAQGNRLVRRDEDPDDGRTVRVLLTPQGQRMLALLSPLHRDQMQRMAAALTPPRWEDIQPDPAAAP
jgi:DNA-binding MarR family transcriptional regulator